MYIIHTLMKKKKKLCTVIALKEQIQENFRKICWMKHKSKKKRLKSFKGKIELDEKLLIREEQPEEIKLYTSKRSEGKT